MNSEVEERKDKCVYVHKLNGLVVYVGSGTIRRATNPDNRTLKHLEVFNNLEKVIIKDNLTESESKTLEQELIKKYWNSGNLLNKNKKVAKTSMVKYADVCKFFYYDETAQYCLRRKISMGNAFPANQEAGCKNNRGYIRVKLKTVAYSAHRVVYALYHKIDLPCNLVIDHVDGNPSNNRISNLRLVSQSDNCRNRKHKASNTGYQGVIDSQKQYRFSVCCQIDLKRHIIRFSYAPNPKKNRSTNHYLTRELALEAAINYRNELVSQGLIVLT